MKTFTAAFQQLLDAEVTTLANMVKITRGDGEIFTFTSFDRDLIIDGRTYKSAKSFKTSATASSADFQIDNVDIQGILDDEDITRDDILSGLFEDALVEVFVVDYNNLPANLTAKNDLWWILTSEVGQVSFTDDTDQFIFQLRGLSDRMSRKGLEIYGPLCRVKRLGDERCKVGLSSFTFSYTVATVTDSRTFTHTTTAQADDYFQYGIVSWTGGQNDPFEHEIKSYKSGVITLTEEPHYPIQVGDTFRAIRGCDRQFSTCQNVFNNVRNFRGEPESLFPGNDKLIAPNSNAG